MKKIVITLLFLFMGMSVNAAQLRFAQVSDVNYGENNEFTKQLLDWNIRSINLKKPQFTVFLGNNIEKSREENIEGFLDKVKELKKPYYVVVGNKDSYKISGIERSEFWSIVNKNSKYNKSKKSYYTFSPNSDFLCVVMDGAVPFSHSAHGIYNEEQVKWLDNILTKNKNKKVIIFQHFPIVEPAEKYDLRTLYKDKYEEVLKKHNNIVMISSGHYNTAKTYIDEKGVYHISTPALNKSDYVYDIVTIDYKKLPLTKMKIKNIDVKHIDLQ